MKKRIFLLTASRDEAEKAPGKFLPSSTALEGGGQALLHRGVPALRKLFPTPGAECPKPSKEL